MRRCSRTSTGQILELRHDKNHAGYVKSANDTLDQIAEARDKNDSTKIVGSEKTRSFSQRPCDRLTPQSLHWTPRSARYGRLAIRYAFASRWPWATGL
jgi:hypothetical protein